MIYEVMDEVYESMGIPAKNNGKDVLIVRDSGFEADDRTLPTFKIRASDIDLYRDAHGVMQMVSQEFDIDGGTYDVISWEYVGNKREEILFAVEGDSRGR